MKKNYIPTIDVSPILHNNFECTKCIEVIKKIEKACVRVGFFSNYWSWNTSKYY